MNGDDSSRLMLYLSALVDTERLGASLAPFLQAGDVVLLSGDLGQGKTSLCRGLLRSFTSDPALETPSPSYLIAFEYRSNANVVAYHLDPYRLAVGRVAGLVDFDRALKEGVLLIEWPERLGSDVTLQIKNDARRVLEITFQGLGVKAVGRTVCVSGRSGAFADWIAEAGKRWGAEHAVGGTAVTEPAVPESCEKIETGSIFQIPILQSTRNFQVSSLPSESLVLGIESSCDDTACAVVRGDGTVIAQCIASQSGIHSPWGGVVPSLAREAHAAAIDRTVEECLLKAGVGEGGAKLSGVAVTVGPGLAICLMVGVRKALEISKKFQVPLIKVHHMEAHMLVTRLGISCEDSEIKNSMPTFPFITALVSGGHSLLVLSRGLGDHTLLGSSLDDSAGEAFDKVARLLGIEQVPGGPLLEILAKTGEAGKLNQPLPRPLTKTRDTVLIGNCDFSFAGLKTAVKDRLTAGEDGANVAAAFQERVGAHLAERAERAVGWARDLLEENSSDLKHLVVAGGVAANSRIRECFNQVAERTGLILCVPPPNLCSDNGVMVAWTGIERLRQGLYDAPINASDEDLDKFVEVLPRWALGPKDQRSVGKVRIESGSKRKIELTRNT